MRSALIHTITLSMLAALAAGCSSATEGAPVDQTSSAATAVPSFEEWRNAMSQSPLPKEGCFTASHPSTAWVEVPCGTAPEVPYLPARGRPRPQTVGNGADFSAGVSGTLSRAVGSFPSVSVSSESDGSSNNYSLQLNSNFFSGASPCKNAKTPSSCMGWQQFIYVPGAAFMQYWLLNYDKSCPSGWNTSGNDCYKNSASVSVPSEPISNLGRFVVTANAGTTDTVTVSTGDGKLYAQSKASVVNLNKGWNTAEFNVVGNANGSEAVFTGPASIEVQLLTTSGSSSAPTCEGDTGFTAETNNLSLVANSCTAFGGSSPGIRFTEHLAEPTSVPVAFQANTGNLWLDQGYIATDQELGMMAGTTPSIAVLPSGAVVVAFQANTGNLWLEENGSGYDQQLGMMAGTSPSIAVLPGGEVAVAFQANTGSLWLEENGVGTDQRLGMAAGTSPSLAALPSGGVEIAFQANTGNLWLDQNGVGTDQQLGMMARTSPSLAILTNGTPAVAFQANTGNLWLVKNGAADLSLGMAAPASPSIVALPNAGYQIAFEANTGNLWVDVSGIAGDEFLGMNTP